MLPRTECSVRAKPVVPVEPFGPSAFTLEASASAMSAPSAWGIEFISVTTGAPLQASPLMLPLKLSASSDVCGTQTRGQH